MKSDSAGVGGAARHLPATLQVRTLRYRTPHAARGNMQRLLPCLALLPLHDEPPPASDLPLLQPGGGDNAMLPADCLAWCSPVPVVATAVKK